MVKANNGIQHSVSILAQLDMWVIIKIIVYANMVKVILHVRRPRSQTPGSRIIPIIEFVMAP